MKHNASIIARFSFGQFIQHGINLTGYDFTGPRISGNSRISGTEDICGGEETLRKKVLNQKVVNWRRNSLRGVTGMPCPCALLVPAGPAEGDVLQDAESIAEQNGLVRRRLQRTAQGDNRRDHILVRPAPYTRFELLRRREVAAEAFIRSDSPELRIPPRGERAEIQECPCPLCRRARALARSFT